MKNRSPHERKGPARRTRAAATRKPPTATTEVVFRAVSAILRGESPQLPEGVRWPRLALPPFGGREQRRELVRGSGFTYRDEANAIVAQVLRSGFLEELHAGRSSPLLLDPEYSRITQGEMKRLMIETTAKLASWLAMRDRVVTKDPYKYLLALSGTRAAYTNHWDRTALTSEVPPQTGDDFAVCCNCDAPLADKWKFCPQCGGRVATVPTSEVGSRE